MKSTKKKGRGKPPSPLAAGAVYLARLRKEVEATQAEMATAIGVSITTISKCERGESEPSFTLKQIKALCKFANKEVSQMPNYFGRPPAE